MPEPLRLLELVCGLFFIPHLWAKLFEREAVLGFFQAAGYRPAAAFMWLAFVVECGLVVCLIGGLYPKFSGIVAATFLVIAGISVAKVSKGRWLWNLGGCEYLFFWAACCAIVALAR